MYNKIVNDKLSKKFFNTNNTNIHILHYNDILYK